MSVEFIGMIQQQKVSEIHQKSGPAVDIDYIRTFAQAHENAGFDRILVPHHSTGPDATLTIAYAASVTKHIHFMLAHRPGFIAPTLAARQLATLDQLTRGRLAVHIVSGGSDAEQRRDGDYLSHDERYARTDEYLDVLRRVWTESGSFNHAGRYYTAENVFSDVKTVQQPHIPIYFGGASAPALAVAGKYADVYALWGESKAQVAEQIAAVRRSAAKHQRNVRFSVSFRPILAPTEKAAWERADHILAETRRLRAEQGLGVGAALQSEGARRLLAAAGDGVCADDRLWTGIAKEIGGRSNSTALVGTSSQVADTLSEYHQLGVSTFLIRGFDPVEDAMDYGRELIPATRDRIAHLAQAA